MVGITVPTPAVRGRECPGPWLHGPGKPMLTDA